MNESVGNSLLLNLVLIIVGVIMLFYVGIISYSKAYRVKDNVIEIVEKYNGYTYSNSSPTDVQNEISQSLKQSGYSIASGNKINNLCTSGSVARHMSDIMEAGPVENLHKVPDTVNDYNYCIFKVNKSAFDSANYYVIVTFVHFDFPVIGDRLNIPVYGETKVLGKNYDY